MSRHTQYELIHRWALYVPYVAYSFIEWIFSVDSWMSNERHFYLLLPTAPKCRHNRFKNWLTTECFCLRFRISSSFRINITSDSSSSCHGINFYLSYDRNVNISSLFYFCFTISEWNRCKYCLCAHLLWFAQQIQYQMRQLRQHRPLQPN